MPISALSTLIVGEADDGDDGRRDSDEAELMPYRSPAIGHGQNERSARRPLIRRPKMFL
jgi:hypothetical protein